MTLDKTVRRGMNNLAVCIMTDLADIVDKKIREDLWKFSSG